MVFKVIEFIFELEDMIGNNVILKFSIVGRRKKKKIIGFFLNYFNVLYSTFLQYLSLLHLLKLYLNDLKPTCFIHLANIFFPLPVFFPLKIKLLQIITIQ